MQRVSSRLVSVPARHFSSTSIPKAERVRRSLFNIPGSEEKKLKKSEVIQADSLVFDLEDGVAFNRKEIARQLIVENIDRLKLPTNSEIAVRINHVGSGLELADLTAVLRSQRLESIVIPKVEHPHQVRFVANVVDSILDEDRRKNFRFLAAIESAMGIMNLKEIATADPRLDALIFASEDFVADTGMTRTASRKELLYARSAVVTTAVAFGLQSIDLVCVDYQNEGILREECLEGKQMGFTGKQAIHPNQVGPIQELFAPGDQEVEKAARIVLGYRKYLKEGIGAFTLDGKMIDLPVVKWAEKILARAKQAGRNISALEEQ